MVPFSPSSGSLACSEPRNTPEDWPSATYELKIRIHFIKDHNTIFVLLVCVSVLVCHHLYDETFSWLAVGESRAVIIVIKHSDEGCACGAARGRTTVLNHHHQLVARLLLSVQSSPCTDLTWGEKDLDERGFMQRHTFRALELWWKLSEPAHFDQRHTSNIYAQCWCTKTCARTQI